MSAVGLRLRVATSPEWLQAVLSDFDRFLLDHAACERKASATALHLVAHYRDRKLLVDAMVDLACEELEHFRRVYALIAERGLQLLSDEKDAYVNGLVRHTRQGSDVYFMDRLLIGAIVEARGCERFSLIAEAAPDAQLREFYAELTRAEARHRGLFLRLAREYFESDAVAARLEGLLVLEAELVQQLPFRAALH